MKQSISFYDFERAFDSMRPDNFSHKGLRALFAYFEEYEDSTGEELELDVIAICCEFTEYSNFEELKANYDNIKDMDDLIEKTTVIYIDDSDGFIIAEKLESAEWSNNKIFNHQTQKKRGKQYEKSYIRIKTLVYRE